jgi:hypothetical protein
MGILSNLPKKQHPLTRCYCHQLPEGRRCLPCDLDRQAKRAEERFAQMERDEQDRLAGLK